MKTFIQGRVIDAVGLPVADAVVYIEAGPGSHPDIALVTGEDGRFALPAVTVPGAYRIGVRTAAGSGAAEAVLGGAEDVVTLEIRIGGGP